MFLLIFPLKKSYQARSAKLVHRALSSSYPTDGKQKAEERCWYFFLPVPRSLRRQELRSKVDVALLTDITRVNNELREKGLA